MPIAVMSSRRPVTGSTPCSSRADDAVSAAIAAQRALQRETDVTDVPLVVRMGLHAGAGEERDGDYFGSAVNRAARVMAVAHGGQVLASRAVHDLVGAELDDSVELISLGEHRLRDLAQPLEIYQVVGPGLTCVFPPLESLGTQLGNLPAQHSSFVGREREVADVVALLGATRIVTLTGVGGVGKTRLACRVAAEVSPRFLHGAWLVELDRVRDPDRCRRRRGRRVRSGTPPGSRAGRDARRPSYVPRSCCCCSTTASTCWLRWPDCSASWKTRARGSSCSRRAARVWASPRSASSPCRRSACPTPTSEPRRAERSRTRLRRTGAGGEVRFHRDRRERRGGGGSGPPSRRHPARGGAGRRADPGLESRTTRATARPAVPVARRR